MIGQPSLANCEFEQIIPNSWVMPLDMEYLSAHMTDLDQYACKRVLEYQLSVNTKSEDFVDCSSTTPESHPILEIIRQGDEVGYFSSPAECRSNPQAPLYGGYVVYRHGVQIGFELKVGTHNKALNSQASPAGTPQSGAN